MSKQGPIATYVTRKQFRFNPDTRKELQKLGLSARTLRYLERSAWREKNFLIYLRNKPDSTERRKRITQLRDTTHKLSGLIERLDPTISHSILFIEDFGVHLSKLQDELIAIQKTFDVVLSKKGRAGNSETDLCRLVYSTAEVLLDHDDGSIVMRYGTKFREILRLVFETMGEKAGSIEIALEKAWKEPAENVDIAAWRPMSIEDLICSRRNTDDNWLEREMDRWMFISSATAGGKR